MVDAVNTCLQRSFWEDLSPRFFVTFWTLSMYDLEVPKASYDRETDKLKQQSQALEDNPTVAATKKKKDIERSRLLLEKLLEEQLKQDQHVSRIRSCLENEKDQWFCSNNKKMEMTAQFYQFCLFPRSLFTASDALYSAKFVHVLHTLKTPNFSTLICYDRIFGDISYTMSSCTENEASHYGVFLSALLETVMRWHKDKALFDKECSNFPGFVTKITDDHPCYIDYEDYRHVCHKWHYRLTKALILCLDSEDYIQVRNSLVILTKIIGHFPVITNFALSLEKRVEALRSKEKDNRKDLYALATGYVGQLKLKKPTFMPEHDFHFKEIKKPSLLKSVKPEPSKSRTDKVKQDHSSSSPSSTPKREDKPEDKVKKEDAKRDHRQRESPKEGSLSKRNKDSKTDDRTSVVKMEVDSNDDCKKFKMEGQPRESRSKEGHRDMPSTRDHRDQDSSRDSRSEVKRDRESSSKNAFSFEKKALQPPTRETRREDREYSSERKGVNRHTSQGSSSQKQSSKSSVENNVRVKSERVTPETSNGMSSARGRVSHQGSHGRGDSKRPISSSSRDDLSPNKRRKNYYDDQQY